MDAEILKLFKSWKFTKRTEWDSVDFRKKRKCIGKGKSALVYELENGLVAKVYMCPWSRECIFGLQDNNGTLLSVFWSREDLLDYVAENRSSLKDSIHKLRIVAWDYKALSPTKVGANQFLTEHFVHKTLSDDPIMRYFVVPWHDFGRDIHGRCIGIFTKADGTLEKSLGSMKWDYIETVLAVLCYAMEYAQQNFHFRHQDLHVENVFLVKVPDYDVELRFPAGSDEFVLKYTCADKSVKIEHGSAVYESPKGLEWLPWISDFGFSSLKTRSGITVTRLDLELFSDPDYEDHETKKRKDSWGPYSCTIEPNFHGYDLQVLSTSILSELKDQGRSKRTIRSAKNILQNSLGPYCNWDNMSKHDRPSALKFVSPVKPVDYFRAIVLTKTIVFDDA